MIDLNCDMGELADGRHEAALMEHITSANIACGGHAGDEATMERTARLAIERGVRIGAHPGYPDPANFGRLEMEMSGAETADTVYRQILRLEAVVHQLGASIVHVKPHGALYNQAVRDRALAAAIAAGVARWSRDVVLVGLAGSLMLEVFRTAGFQVASEAFADRRYEPDGTLRSRKSADALLRDPAEAGRQALAIARGGTVVASDGSEVALVAQTICIHGDTPGATAISAEVARVLRDASIKLTPMAGD